MNAQQDKIRIQQKATWDSFSPMWKKWDSLLASILHPLTAETLAAFQLEKTAKVLDIASGTGEPGLTIATTVPYGEVVLGDLSEKMLQIAKEKAKARNIENIAICICDACQLPFADATFNAVSSRLGFMFFPDMLLAASEMHRVLKPGGKVAVSVWDRPEKNFWASAIATTVMQQLKIPPPPPDAPGLFRCSNSGGVQQLLKQAGFINTSEKGIACQMDFDTAEDYWTMVTEVTPPLALALSKADALHRSEIKQEVLSQIDRKFPDGNISFQGNTLFVYGEKAN